MTELKLTNQNFKEEVLNSTKPVLVDFWAPWCMPCRMLGPVIAQIAKEHDDIKVGKVNVDEESELSRKYQITSIPMVALFKNGEIVKTSLGFVSKSVLEKMIGE